MTSTVGPIEALMTADHARLDALLRTATADDAIDLATFEEFREGLLRHIGMEEKILVPMLRDRGAPFVHARELRRDHGEIAKRLVPTPTIAACEALRQLLSVHNAIEEGASGLYAKCDEVAGADAETIALALRGAPRVPLAPHYDGPLIKR